MALRNNAHHEYIITKYQFDSVLSHILRID